MPEVWNAANPQTSNSVAADVADIQENFSYLEDLLTNFFKTWSASSTAIGKNSRYYVNPSAADQGADDNARSFKDLQDTIGTTNKAIFCWPHFSADGNTTTYTFGTSETSESNITNIVESGVIIAGAGTLTVNGTMIALGDLTVGNGTNGALTIAAGGRLIVYGTLTVAANATLTNSAGATIMELGTSSIVGTFTNSGTMGGRRRLLYTSSTSSQESGTGETNLHSFSLIANNLPVGRSMDVRAHFYLTMESGSSTITIKFYVGSESVTLFAQGYGVVSGTDEVSVKARVVRTASSTILILYETLVYGGLGGYNPWVGRGSITADLTSNQTVKFTGRASNAADTLYQVYSSFELV